MNVDKAKKELDFQRLLEKMGYFPVKETTTGGRRELWFKSPLNHSDKTASFHITEGKKVAWVFKCFSTGEEGTIIDFVIAHEGYAKGDVKSALAFLRDKFPGSLFDYQAKKGGKKPQASPDLFSFHQQSDNSQEGSDDALAADKNLEYIEDLPLRSGRLIAYLEKSRKIPARLAQKYLRLVRYKNLKSGKTFYGIAMKNRAGGFETRAGSDSYTFKSALIARDLTIIKAAAPSDVVLVYEGMMDFLAHLVMMGRDEPPCDCIVMHSVNSYRKAVNFIGEAGYRRICTLLDNDESGRTCTKRFESEFPGRVTSYSHFLHPFKDVNQCLQRDKPLPPFDHLSDAGPDYTPA